jgi:hypothetical protein
MLDVRVQPCVAKLLTFEIPLIPYMSANMCRVSCPAAGRYYAAKTAQRHGR